MPARCRVVCARLFNHAQAERCADTSDAYVICLYLPREDNGSGVRTYWSQQVHEDAQGIAERFAIELIRAVAPKRSNAVKEQKLKIDQLRQENAAVEKQAAKWKGKATAMKREKAALKATVDSLRATIASLETEGTSRRESGSVVGSVAGDEDEESSNDGNSENGDGSDGDSGDDNSEGDGTVVDSDSD